MSFNHSISARVVERGEGSFILIRSSNSFMDAIVIANHVEVINYCTFCEHNKTENIFYVQVNFIFYLDASSAYT